MATNTLLDITALIERLGRAEARVATLTKLVGMDGAAAADALRFKEKADRLEGELKRLKEQLCGHCLVKAVRGGK